MIQKRVRNFLNKDITKIFSLNAIATLVKMLTGFVSVKVVAVLIGPSGVALLGQLNNFSSILLGFSTGGITSGVTKYVAEYVASQSKVNVFLRTALWITMGFSLICAIVLIAGAGFFSQLILRDSRYRLVFVIFGCTIVFYALNSLLISILNGYKQFKKYVRINIIGSLVSLLFSVTFAYFLSIYGALLAVVTYQSVVFFVTLTLVTKCEWFKKNNFVGKFDRIAGKKLAHYSVMALVVTIAMPVSQLIVRDYLVSHTSLVQTGIWEGMNRISGMYLMVITSSLSVYYLPRLAEIKVQHEIRKEVFSVYRMIIPLLLSATLCIYYLREFIIQALFSEEFRGMSQLFGFQLTGDFLKITAWVLSFQMLAKAMTRLLVTTEIIFSISSILLSMVFIDSFGIIGATMAYALNYLGYLLMMVVIFRKMIFRG